MNLNQARQLITAAEQKAESLGISVCIAVVDAGAHLVSFSRMDGAFLGSVDVAVGKGRTSALFPLPSGQFGEIIRNEALTGMENSNGGLVAFPGGMPVMSDSCQIGAIGISGGTAEQDEAIASHAAQQLETAG